MTADLQASRSKRANLFAGIYVVQSTALGDVYQVAAKAKRQASSPCAAPPA